MGPSLQRDRPLPEWPHSPLSLSLGVPVPAFGCPPGWPAVCLEFWISSHHVRSWMKPHTAGYGFGILSAYLRARWCGVIASCNGFWLMRNRRLKRAKEIDFSSPTDESMALLASLSGKSCELRETLSKSSAVPLLGWLCGGGRSRKAPLPGSSSLTPFTVPSSSLLTVRACG